MGVIRITKHEAPYVMLDKTALKDKRLSFRARGIHAYLMSKPDDWTIHIEELAKQSPTEGREAVATGLKELETYGYIRRHRVRDALGRMSGWDTVVYETPWLAAMADEDAQLTDDSPTTGLPTSAKPISVDEPETIDMSESTPTTGLPTSAKPISVSPKTGLPNAANPQLLIKETTKRNETTKDNTTIPVSEIEPKKKGRQRKVESLCPSNYQASLSLVEAIQEKYPGANVPRLVDAMKDWSESKSEKRANWDATLRTFARIDWEKRGSPLHSIPQGRRDERGLEYSEAY